MNNLEKEKRKLLLDLTAVGSVKNLILQVTFRRKYIWKKICIHTVDKDAKQGEKLPRKPEVSKRDKSPS